MSRVLAFFNNMVHSILHVFFSLVHSQLLERQIIASAKCKPFDRLCGSMTLYKIRRIQIGALVSIYIKHENGGKCDLSDDSDDNSEAGLGTLILDI